MKQAVLLFCVSLLISCASQPVPQQPSPIPGVLAPYATLTPSTTPEQPDGLIVSFETPLPTPTPFTYTIQQGDTLSQIAEKFGVSLDELVAANPDISPNSMSVGMELQIPSNPANPTGVSTPTPVPVPVKQIICHPTADGGLWCFVLLQNPTSDFMENFSAQVTLVDASGQSLASALAISPLDILPPNTSLPLTVYFAPPISPDAQPRAQIVTGVTLLPGDERYLPATIRNTFVEVDWNGGRSAQVRGQVWLPAESKAANQTWVAAVAYDEYDQVVGVKRWESEAELAPGRTLPFSFEIGSLGGKIERVDFAVEARP